MIRRDDIKKVIEKYDKGKVRVATIGRHSALNILKGAKEEGFSTLCVCRKDEERIYRRFGVADEFIYVKDYVDILDDKIQEELKEKNAIVIPHGSFTAYVGARKIEESFLVPIFGNRALLRWESSRDLQRKWLIEAGLKVPKLYKSPKDIKALVLVKFPGAKGGKGYFIADSEESYYEKMEKMIKGGLTNREDAARSHIQEYIIGVSVYPHFFYSPLKKDIELLGIDKRYESSVDGISRIPAPEQLESKLNPSFTVIGNFPLVVRESLLPEMFEVGDKMIEASKRIAPPGTIGPFCLEMICKDNQEIVVFEVSARIVAGCNAEMGMYPYTYLLYDEPMYMGKRISREIKKALESEKLMDIVT